MLEARDLRPELMDDPGLAGERHHGALRALERINRLSAVTASLWPPIAALAPARVLDLGSGAGDVALGIARRAARAGLEIEVHGSDVSERAVAFANARADAGRHAGDGRLPVRFFQLDAVAGPLPAGYDVVMCSLMLHHLDDAAARRLLAAMGQAARRLVLVSDLERGWPGLVLAWTATRLLTRSDVVHVDGVRSVRAALRPREVLDMAHDAGLHAPRVERRWPFRWLLTSASPGQPT